MNDVDIDTMRMHLVGSYVYREYNIRSKIESRDYNIRSKIESRELEISGDPDIFYLTLGMIIRDNYSNEFNYILEEIIPYKY